jgi:uncharacterized membrane protein
MDTINLFIGSLIIIIGLLIKRFPNMLAGYNTMTKEEKRKIDINGITTIIRTCLILVGLIIIIGSLMSILFNIKKVSIYLIPVVIIVSFPYILLRVQNHKDKK